MPHFHLLRSQFGVEGVVLVQIYNMLRHVGGPASEGDDGH